MYIFCSFYCALFAS